MLLEITCKTGKLQVTDDGMLQIQQMFKQILWQVPCSAVTRITSKDGFAHSSDITFHTDQGRYQAEMVSKLKISKLYALFPGIEVGGNQTQGPIYRTGTQQPPTIQGALGTILFPDIALGAKIVGIGHKKWYQDQKLRTYIVTYTKQKDMQKEVGEAGQYGWIPQSTIGTGGQLKPGWFFWTNSKEKITITYIRTPEWLAQNS